MDFTPYDVSIFAPGSLTTTGALFCAVGVLAMTVFMFGVAIFPERKLAKGQPVRKVVFSIGAVGMVALFISLPVSFTAYFEEITAVADHRQTVADGFTEHYGVKVTAEDVEEMGYPTREPEEEKVVGATTLGSGMKVTLVVDDGKARLYRLGEELPVAD